MSKKRENPDEVYATAKGDAIEDVPASHDPETFDVAAMVRGVRATRLRVKVQPNGHLLARLQEIAEEIDSYASDDDVPDELVDEWTETKADFDHVDVFVIEGRTSDWVRDFESRMKEQGIDPKRKVKGKPLPEHMVHGQIKALVQAQIAEQIVEPEDVSAEDIKALFEGSEPEGDKLYRAMKQVNTQSVGMVTPDFSERVSRLSRRG